MCAELWGPQPQWVGVCVTFTEALFVLQYLVEAQVVLDGVRGVEDGPTGGDNQDKAVEGLRAKHTDS